MMRSPSSLSWMRTVPCVAGCDGPILSSIASKFMSRESCSSIFVPLCCSSAIRSSDAQVVVLRIGMHRTRTDQRLALLLRVVLAQRVALELLVKVDALQVGVAVEDDAVHVPGLALEPVRTRPQRDHARQLRIALLERHLDAYAVVLGERVEVVDDLEARLAAEVV